MATNSKKDKIGFGGSFDLGVKHPKGMEENKDAKFMGTFSDMGQEDAVGVGEGK